MRFVLTGSSARKLKRGAANLLAGRAWEARLFPLTRDELGASFDLITYLNDGGLPDVYGSAHARAELQSYVSLYLREEIQAEALTRNVPAFARFLDAIALSNGQELNYQGLASDCGVAPGTLRSYVEILEDTLIGFTVPGFARTRKRKAIQRAKHYLFDVGVVNALCRRGRIEPRSELFGAAFEQLTMQEVRAYLSYARLDLPMQYWRSTSGFEVDLVLGDDVAIEVKSTALAQDKHLRGLRALAEEGLMRKLIIVSLDEVPRTTSDGIEVLPWGHFLAQLWSGVLVAK